MIEIQISENIGNDWTTNNGRIYPKDVFRKAVEEYVAKHGSTIKVPDVYFEEQSHLSISFKEENKNE